MPRLTVAEVVDEALSAKASTWCRADVLRAICDRQRPDVRDAGAALAARCWSGPPTGWSSTASTSTRPEARPRRAFGWAVGVDRTDRTRVDQRGGAGRRRSDRGVGDRSPTRRPAAVDDGEHRGVGRVAGRGGRRRSPATTSWCWWSGRRGRARRRCSRRAREDLARGTTAPVFGLAPTAKAARVLRARHRHASPTPSPNCSTNGPDPSRTRPVSAAGRATTVVVDEAGMIDTARPAPAGQLRRAATSGGWCWSVTPASCRPSAGAVCSTSCCRNGRVHQLEHIHRFTHPWEADSVAAVARRRPPRTGRLRGARADHPRHLGRAPRPDRRPPGSTVTSTGDTVAVVASTNEHVDLLNAAVQNRRLIDGDLDPGTAVVDRRWRARPCR